MLVTIGLQNLIVIFAISIIFIFISLGRSLFSNFSNPFSFLSPSKISGMFTDATNKADATIESNINKTKSKSGIPNPLKKISKPIKKIPNPFKKN